MLTQQRDGEPVAIVCGGGSLPFAVADAVLRRGRRAVLFPIRGWGDAAAVERYEHHWIALGQFGRMCRLARAEQCRDVVFIGNLVRPPISEIRLDWQTIRLMPRIIGLYRGGDDHLLSGIGRILERDGFRMVGIKDVAPDLLAPVGSLTRTAPDAKAAADIAKGREALSALSPFDIGQAVVVIDGHVVAVEDIEGTDGLLARIAQLRAQGRIRSASRRGVLVKLPKRGQDLRFDLPAIGPQTVAGAVKAELAGIAVLAGNTIVAEPQAMIETADAAGLFLTGLR